MREEIHSIFAVGAGAVTKLVHHNDFINGDSKIERIFNAKYPYEYLRKAKERRASVEEKKKKSFTEQIFDFYEKTKTEN